MVLAVIVLVLELRLAVSNLARRVEAVAQRMGLLESDMGGVAHRDESDGESPIVRIIRRKDSSHA